MESAAGHLGVSIFPVFLKNRIMTFFFKAAMQLAEILV